MEKIRFEIASSQITENVPWELGFESLQLERSITLNTFFFTHKSRGFTGLSAIDFFEREGGFIKR